MFKIRINNQAWRIDEASGFLRCKAVIIEDAVMPYTLEEVGEIPPHVVVGDVVYLHADKAEFGTPEAIATLEGALLTVGHEWQTVNNENSVGHIAGAPYMEGDELYAEVLVTCPIAITRIQLPEGDPDRLVDLSSSYESKIRWGIGRTLSGHDFHGKQTDFEFNHIALLPEGAGRGGKGVRILNKKTQKPEGSVMEFTIVRLSSGVSIRVANEDVEKLEKADDENKEKMDNMADPAKLQEAMSALEAINTQMAELQTQKSEIEGQLQATKEQLEAALSPAKIEEAATQIANERSVAVKIMNSFNGDVKAIEGQQGEELKVLVVTGYRIANQLPELDENQLKDAGFVSGLYKAYSDTVPSKSSVVGAEAVVINNQRSEKAGPHIKRHHAGDKKS